MAILNNKMTILGLSTLFALSACQQAGQDQRADVYDASAVNTVQHGRTVTIVNVTPVRIKVDNSQNQRTATAIGGILGTALGVGLAGGVGHAGWGGDAAAGVGGALAGGALAHSMAGSSTLVDGVTISYTDSSAPSKKEAFGLVTQVGRTCEYRVGSYSLLVLTSDGKTRLQPNAQCPK